jgi:hypothetical protein
MIRSLRATTALRDRIIIVFVALWTASIIGLAISQSWLTYSPIPVWDMWEGYLGFYERASDGDWSVWWSQHNEHRIFLGRLLFWADIHWFRGASIFLLAADYVLLAVIAAMFWQMLGERLPGAKFIVARILLGLFISAWLFLLCQGENLTWAFQGQFFFAFLLRCTYCTHLQRVF